ncbi:xylose isomerase, partial [Thermoproteota archaeon]
EKFAKQEENYREQAQLLKKILGDKNIKLGWGTENLFSHPMYAQGSLNSPYPYVAARAAAEVRLMMEITHQLGGENYVLWGGRVGYDSLLVTDMEKEMNNLGNIYRAIVNYQKRCFPEIQLLEEPKGKEPTTFQYARDAATTLNFFRAIGVFDAFKLNLEGNHGDLAGVDLEHELTVARINGNKIGGIDANSGVPMVGWDVDRYQEIFKDALLAWRQVDLQGGMGTGVINHDAKPRRQSTSMREKAIGHIMAMDLWALALLTVEEMKADGSLDKLRNQIYKRYDETEIGGKISTGDITLETLSDFARNDGIIGNIPSGRYQEAMFHLQRFLLPKR